MATNSPMGTNPYLPPDIQLQQINLQRQQALADALRQQSLESTPSEVVSGRVVPKGILGAIAPLLRAGLANKTQDKVSQGQVGLTKAYSDYLTNSANATLPGGQQQMPSQPTGTTQDGQSVPTYQAPSGQPIGDAGGMSVPVTPNAQPPQAAVQAAGGPQISPQLRAAYVSLLRTGNVDGANKLMEMAWQSQMPNDTSKMAAAAGVDPQQANRDALLKATNIPPTRLGEGAYFDPRLQSVQGLPSAAPPGFINQRGPDGTWQTAPVTGGLQAATTSAGSIEGAKEANKIIMANVNGKMVPVRAGDAVSNNQSQPMPSQPSTERPAFDLPGMNQQQILAKAAAIGDPTEKANFISAASNALPQDINGDQKWQSMPRMQNPTGIGMTPYQEQTQKQAADHGAKLAETYGTAAQNANQRLALNNQALDLVNKSDLGPGSTWTADLKNIAQKYVPGITEDSFKNTPSANIALQKDLVNAATAKAKQQFGSRITQSEVQLMLTRGSPNVSMPKAALSFLLQSDNAGAQYQIQQANDLGKYLNSGGDPYQFEGWYSKTFPMTNATSQVQLQPKLQDIRAQADAILGKK